MNEDHVPRTIDLYLTEQVRDGNHTGVGEFWDKLKRMVDQNASPERICGELARALKVQTDGVALLRLQSNTLVFVYPSKLRSAGTIPITSPAVAARTATTKTTMLSNSFVRVRHASVFEGIKLENTRSDDVAPDPIQKLMSVPIFGEGKEILGVVQISRKGKDADKAGPDFTHEDLRQLEEAASLIAKLQWMVDGEALKQSV